MRIQMKSVLALVAATALLSGCYDHDICETSDGVLWMHLTDPSRSYNLKNLETGESAETAFKTEDEQFLFEPAAGPGSVEDPMMKGHMGKTCEIGGATYVEFARGALYQLVRNFEETEREVYRVHFVGVDPEKAESLGIKFDVFPSPVPGGQGQRIYRNPADNPRLIVEAFLTYPDALYELEVR